MQKNKSNTKNKKYSERNVISKELDEDQPIKKKVLIGTIVVGLGISIILTNQVFGSPNEENIENPIETTSITDAVLLQENEIIKATSTNVVETTEAQEIVSIEEEDSTKETFYIDDELKDAIDNINELGTTIAFTPITIEETTEEEEVIVEETNVPEVEEVEETNEVEVEDDYETKDEPVESEPVTYTYSGSILTAYAGVNYGPTGKETYYNLNMSGVVSIMRNMGFDEENYPYWVREDGCKMLGPYIMVAANLDMFPRGTTVECSLGTALVCDTGGFAYSNPTQLDIATTW